MKNGGALIALLLIALIAVYLYYTQGSRAISSITAQGNRNASSIPLYVSDPLLQIPSGGTFPNFNWGGFVPGDFLVTQDINS